jgi:surface protein
MKVIDVSGFDTQNVTDMAQTFRGCYALEEIIGFDKWDTRNVTTTYAMFNTNPGYATSNHLKEIDLSSFDTSNVTDMRNMFEHSPDLVTIYVGDGWSTDKVQYSDNMFNKCPVLVGGNGTTYDSTKLDVTYACVDTPESPGYFTYKGNTEP